MEEKASNTGFDLIHIISKVHFTLIPMSLREVALLSAGSLFWLKLTVTGLWSNFTEIPDPRFYCRNTKCFIFEKRVRQLSSQTVTISPGEGLRTSIYSPGSSRDLAHMRGDGPSWWSQVLPQNVPGPTVCLARPNQTSTPSPQPTGLAHRAHPRGLSPK